MLCGEALLLRRSLSELVGMEKELQAPVARRQRADVQIEALRNAEHVEISETFYWSLERSTAVAKIELRQRVAQCLA